MRLVAVCLCLVPMLAWPCAPLIDREFWSAESPLAAIEQRFAEKDWDNVLRWVAKLPSHEKSKRLPRLEQRRIRELAARAAIKVGRYREAAHRLTALLVEAPDPALQERLLEAQLRQAELDGTLDQAGVNDASKRSSDQSASVDLRVALVPQLHRAGQAKDAATLCRDLERLEPENAEVKSACSAKPPRPRGPSPLGGCS